MPMPTHTPAEAGPLDSGADIRRRFVVGGATAALAALAGCAFPRGGGNPAGSPPASAAAGPSPAPGAVLQPPAALRVEGVPSLPATLLGPIQRYAQVVGHQFQDWHPERRELLVSHRPPGQSVVQLFRVAEPGGMPVPLTDAAEPVGDARWEPVRGRFVLFERARGGDEAYQVFRLDPATRQAVAITPEGERHDLAGWNAATGRALIGSVPLDRTAAGGRRTDVTTRLWEVDPLAPEAPGGRRTIAELPGGGWYRPEVSPDGRRIAITRYLSATESEVWLIDPVDGQRRRLLPRDGESRRATHFVMHWTVDGAGLLVVSDRASEFRELMRLDMAAGTLQRWTAHIPWDVGGADLSADGGTVAALVNVDGREELRLFDGRTGAERPVPAGLRPPGGVTRVRFHPRTGELAVVANSPQGPSQVHAVDLAAGRRVAWTRPFVPAGLDLSQVPDQQVVRWTSFDGRAISGILSLPPARFEGRRPVLMLMHGGPESQSKIGWNGRLNYLLLERGIALLEPNVRGSSGYGKTFLDLDNGRLREDAVKDMAAAIDWCATHPRLDGRRVVVAGGSYGGYMALAAATRLADRIAGASSSVGISDFVTFLENTESYRRDLRRVEYGDERDPQMRAFLKSISPLTLADRITKPLLVQQGKNDPRVPWTESEQIVRRLQQRGVPVWYLLAENEGHGFARRENADFALATLVRFLEETVLR
jgi:dipeptidyl aminopeptidase/acylaminoacyl peptidase